MEEKIEFYFAMFVVIFTHLPFLFVIYNRWKVKDLHFFTISLFTLICSFLYHWSDVENTMIYYKTPNYQVIQLLGMNPGQWHRLDNVFAILSFQALIIKLMDIENKEFDNLIKWLGLGITVFFQEKGPWKVINTIIPIALALAILIILMLLRLKLPKLERGKSLLAIGCLLIAFVFFALGLDEGRDYLRVNHGMWHLFSVVSGYYFLRAREEEEKSWSKISKIKFI